MAHRRRFGRVRKLSSGRWQARYPDARGVLVAAPQTFPTKTAADRYLANVETDISRGSWFDPRAGQQTLRTYADRWLLARRVKGRPLAPRTRELYRWQLDRHLLPALGEVELRRLDAAEVRSWHATLTGPGRSRRDHGGQVLPPAPGHLQHGSRRRRAGAQSVRHSGGRRRGLGRAARRERAAGVRAGRCRGTSLAGAGAARCVLRPALR